MCLLLGIIVEKHVHVLFIILLEANDTINHNFKLKI